MKFDKMLTIGNNHVTCDTMLALHIEPWVNQFWFIEVHPNGQYGKFILLDKEKFEQADKHEPSPMPDDLRAAIRFAISKQCTVICLDPNGERADDLEYYDN